MTLDVCVAGVLGVVQILLNIIQDAIMTVCVPSLVKTDHTTIKNVVQCLSLTTETLLIGHLLAGPEVEEKFWVGWVSSGYYV